MAQKMDNYPTYKLSKLRLVLETWQEFTGDCCGILSMVIYIVVHGGVDVHSDECYHSAAYIHPWNSVNLH